MPKFLEKLSVGMAVLVAMFFCIRPAYAAGSTLKVLDTTAGQPALIMVSGKPFEVVELKISNPFRSTISQKFQLNEKGILQHWYPQAVMAGSYRVAFEGSEAPFYVSAGAPSPEKSILDLSDYTAFVGGRIDFNLTLKDRFGNLVINRPMDLKSKGSLALTCSNNCRSNQKGIVKFTAQSDRAGLKKLAILDRETEKALFTENLGFIPLIETPVVRGPLRYSAASIWDELESEEDYIPVLQERKATRNSRGNDDRYLAYSKPQSSFRYLQGQVLSTDAELMETASELAAVEEEVAVTTKEEVIVQNTAQLGKFEIIFGTDEKKAFEEEAKVTANSALDFIIRAVDSSGTPQKNYKGQVAFEIDPKGPLLPSDYTFSEIDQGKALFELALVLPVGQYTFKISDLSNPGFLGEVKINSQIEGLPAINNTDIILTLDSPINGSFYSKDISVKGAVSTDNTEIAMKEAGVELKKGMVDQEKKFEFGLSLADGKHSVEIIATYLVDGSQTKTEVSFEVDKTAPVISKVNSDIPPVRAGEPFTMTVEADSDATLKAFINNRAYEFVGNGKIYSLNAQAPAEVGKQSIDLHISDKFGNAETTTGAATLTVLEPLLELKNLFGIPGMGTITLSWDPADSASQYEVTHESIIGQSEVIISKKNTITIENLSDTVNYVFTVVAKDEKGGVVSLETETSALTPLTPKTEEPIHQAAALPKRHTNSGPEVYVVILVSLVILNLYGKMRKALAN